MNAIEDTLDQVVTALQKLHGAPAVTMTIVVCIVFGYLLRFIKAFPNNGIPVAVTLFGAIFYSVIADADNGITLRIWLARNVGFGACVGFAAWLFHYFVLKPVEDKFFPDQPANPPPPAAPVAPVPKP